MKKILKRLATGFLAFATIVTALPTTAVHASEKQYWTESAERVGIVEKVMNDGSIGSTFKGRTSRGTMALMHDYAELINELRPTAEQFTEIEQYWVKRIQAFFTSKPFKLESDNSLSVDAAVEHLLRQAAQRRRENPGTMYVGTVLQHLVAAKLTIVAPEVEINGASVADDPSPRLPTVRPRTVSQNRPRLRPPVSSQLTTPTGSGASSRKRHCDAPYTRRRHCPVPPGTGRSAPLRCRAVRHPICHVSDRSRIWRRRIDARCAERQRSRRWRATAGWLPAAGHPAAARQASLPRIASDRSRPDRSRGNTPPLRRTCCG